MTIGLTDTLVPLGGFAITRDTDLLGGMRSVVDIAARDAIPIEGVESIASRRKEGMLVYVQSDGIIYQLTTGLTNGDWEVYTPISNELDVYLSSGGNDANDGSSIGQAVATWPRAWQIAANSANVTLHLIGAVTGYVVPPPAVRWLTITGDENFTVVATGAAGAATDPYQVELAVAVTAEDYRHFTIEFTDGAAAGFRRTIRDNSATIVTPVYPFDIPDIGVVTPLPGDTYRILRPSAKLSGLSADAGVGNFRIMPLADVLSATRVDLINVAVGLDNESVNLYSNYVAPAAAGAWFGVLTEYRGFVDCVQGTVVAGVDNRTTFPDIVALVREKLGMPGYVNGQWHGWGLGFLDARFDTLSFSGNNVSGLVAGSDSAEGWNSFFYGFVTCFYVIHPRCEFLGGSCSYIVANSSRIVVLGSAAFLIRSLEASPVAVSNGGTFVLKSRTTGTALILDVSGSQAGDLIKADSSSTLSFAGVMDVIFTRTSACNVFGVRNGSTLLYQPNSATQPTWAMGALSGMLILESGSSASLYLFHATGAYIFRNNGGVLQLYKGTSTTPTAVSTGAVLEQTAGGSTSLFGDVVLTGDQAELISVADGSFVQVAGTATITNNAVGTNDVLRLRSGAQAKILGGANTVLDGSAGASGYAINARGGGRVFTVAQPSGATGVTADLTVGVGGGEDQPDTFLATSFSSLVSGDTLSAIARST